jgi:hypothetical protein
MHGANPDPQLRSDGTHGQAFCLLPGNPCDHLGIRSGRTEPHAAQDAQTRSGLLRDLAVLLLGHAQAEESVLYPALAAADEKAHAEIGYNEQALVKMQMAILETLPPMSKEFMEKLDHIEGAGAAPHV